MATKNNNVKINRHDDSIFHDISTNDEGEEENEDRDDKSDDNHDENSDRNDNDDILLNILLDHPVIWKTIELNDNDEDDISASLLSNQLVYHLLRSRDQTIHTELFDGLEALYNHDSSDFLTMEQLVPYPSEASDTFIDNLSNHKK
ncbi:unnamed protein product [Cunninghamella echinulata]